MAINQPSLPSMSKNFCATTTDNQLIRNIRALQCLLNYRVGAGLVVDGDFGNITHNAVYNYQVSRGLYADGEAGPITLNSLLTYPSNISVMYPNNPPYNAALAAQWLLQKFEPSILTDGAFGYNSDAYARTFQTKMESLLVDGDIGPLSFRYLFGISHYYNFSYSVYGSPGVVYSSPLANTPRMYTNVTYIYNFLRNTLGFTKQAACAVLGNMQQESIFDPGLWESSEPLNRGFGLIQWSKGRLTNLMTYLVSNYGQSTVLSQGANLLVANNPSNMMNGQLWFMSNEFSTSAWNPYPSPNYSGYNMPFATFKASTLSAGTLAIVFHDQFIVSNESLPTINATRVAYANNWYSYF